MTYEELLQALLGLDPKWRRENQVAVFDYAKNKFLDMKNLGVCLDGQPKFHLTIEGRVIVKGIIRHE